MSQTVVTAAKVEALLSLVKNAGSEARGVYRIVGDPFGGEFGSNVGMDALVGHLEGGDDLILVLEDVLQDYELMRDAIARLRTLEPALVG